FKRGTIIAEDAHEIMTNLSHYELPLLIGCSSAFALFKGYSIVSTEVPCGGFDR
ncbi:hypothetical protein L218DRAFT_859522, partial [Marasmius fiardii PR-910]